MPSPDDTLDAIARALADPATSVLFITGAGISADSGLPTYRGVGGLYESVETDAGLPIEEVLSGPMLAARPDLTWRYLRQLADACRGRRFNRGHEIIAAFERRQHRVWTLTQNVDGFHRAAGARNVIDIHGDLHDLCCTRCAWRTRVDLDDDDGSDGSDAPPPRCPDCDAVARPDVVLFGETLPESKIGRLFDEVERGFDVVFTIGTSSVFPYIVAPVVHAARTGAMTIEINPGETDVSAIVTHRLATGAAEALDLVWSRLG